MIKNVTAWLLFAALLAVSAGQATAELSNRDKAIAVLRGIQSGDATPIKTYINPNKYIQHNPYFPDGSAGLIGGVEAGAFKGTTIDTPRTIQDGEFVVTQSKYGGTWNQGNALITIDVFRFEDGLIVEHWDNSMPVSPKPNPSGNSQLDGFTLKTELDKTDANRALAKSYIDTILVQGQFDKIHDFVEGDNYIQHHPDIANGVSGLQAALKAFADKGIHMEYDTIHAVHAEGNFALVMSEGKFGGKHFAYFDFLRVADAKIVEHWGVMAPIPPKSDWKNENGKF